MANPSKSDIYRKLPSVDDLLRSNEFAHLRQQVGRVAVANAARHVLGEMRQAVAAGQLDETGLSCAVGNIYESVTRQLRQDLAYSLRAVINATGVVLHTNLGRAPLARTAIDHIAETACTYSNLEYDIATGERGRRDVHAQRLFERLFGRDDLSTVVVNNNAAAVLLCLNALAEGGEVVVSRGELVEIGGSFRIPEVMAKSGAILHEVGTTNRTRIKDYENAINERTRLLLRVHRSNFEITGFTERPSRKELVELGHRRGIPVMDDLGSGALVDLTTVGIRGEPNVLEIVGEGVDVVTYSGDKMLGGPQAGLITGRRELVARVRSNPLFRALRVDKLIYASLEASLLAFLREDLDAIPALRLMRTTVEELQRRAEAILERLKALHGRQHLVLEIRESESVPGGGSAPSATLPTRVLALRSSTTSADEIARLLRLPGDDESAGGPQTIASETAPHTPVIARVEQNLVLLDLRTVFPEQDAELARALERLESVCAERCTHR